MHVKVLACGWTEGTERDTYEVRIQVGSVKTGTVLRSTQSIVHWDTTPSHRAYIERRAKDAAGLSLIEHLTKEHKPT